jgi:RNA polymerase sigma-70 factor, ECF subfamily
VPGRQYTTAMNFLHPAPDVIWHQARYRGIFLGYMTPESQSATEQTGSEGHPIDVHDAKQPAVQEGQVQADWVARLRSGDRSAAEQLVEQHYHRIYLYMRQLGHNRQTSEDLTQEAFMKAWYHVGQLKDGNALSAWLFRIAHNVSCQHRRGRGRREAADEERIRVMGDEQGGRGIGLDRVAHTEQLELLQKEVQCLPLKLRQTIVLHYLQGFPISAAAQVVGVREGTFKSRLNRALEVLRRGADLDHGPEAGQ